MLGEPHSRRTTRDLIYQPRYGKSHALIIGINEYRHTKHLNYACNDATVVARTIVEKFGFAEQDVLILKDDEATSANIRQQFMRFAEITEQDDRVFVFFAGHGFTRTARRGEVGYLVPHEGLEGDLSSLIRWHDLTQGADHFPAKHVLFVMDACYGGLALSRYVAPGSYRFLKNMLQRYSRQVLTAGKADELVADSGGPRPGHSVFTGHFLDALDGAATKPDGILTANNVMAYVYDRVSKDLQSRQTPHYGPLEGDGDFIFSVLLPELTDEEAKKDVRPVVIQVPPAFAEQEEVPMAKDIIETIKEYLPEPRYKIRLDDIFTAEIRRVVGELSSNAFTANPGPGDPPFDFAARLTAYEGIVKPLQGMTALLGKWAAPEHHHIFRNEMARLSELNLDRSGMTTYWGVRWYPLCLLMYSGGIAALSTERYDNLAAIFLAKVDTGLLGNERREALFAMTEGMLQATRADLFKTLPGHDRHYAPESEYIFKSLQPIVEDILFLGKSYEGLFDRHEILRTLVYADLRKQYKGLSFWGPPGRFAWKYTSRAGSEENPFSQLVQEADRLKDLWPPLQAGLFEGSYLRFKEVAIQYSEFMMKLGWF